MTTQTASVTDKHGHLHDGRGRFAEKPLDGQAALDATPARLVDDGLGMLHPQHKRGMIQWSGSNPGWSESDAEAHLLAVEDYRGGGFRPVNQTLRGIEPRASMQFEVDLGPEGFKQHVRDRITKLDEVMKQSRLTDDIVAIRGTETGRGVFGDALKGDLTGFEWTENAYTSTTVNPKVAEYFTISGLSMNIHVPKGTGAVNLSGFKRQDGEDDEAEILLERGLRFRVLSDSGPGEPRHLEVEVVRG